ncbi:hypothetical protein BJY52DRAFT_220000 [Lactarius psammicola]|nr:hypothetical protein BJY52DRAFT_220000 [Lactarius psammicola]
MGPFPIFLVKRELDSKYLNKIGDLTSGYADTTHWALEVRGIHYHLGTGKSMKSSSSNYGVKGLSLDKSNLSQRLIPWYLLGVSNKGHHVGDTHMSDWEIEQTGYAILSEWKSRNIKYNLLQWNCQHFVGFLLARISLTIPKMLVSWFAMPIEVLVPQLESSIVSPGDLNFITLLYWVYYYPYQFSVLRDLPWQSKAVQSILESLLG